MVKQKKKKRGAGLVPRGGFIGTSGRMPGFVGNVTKGIQNFIIDEAVKQGTNLGLKMARGVAKKYPRAYKTSMRMAEYVGGNIDKDGWSKISRMVTEKVGYVEPETNALSEKGDKIPQISAFTKNNLKTDFQGPVKSRTFTTEFRYGKRTSRSLINHMKTYGSKRICTFDTLNDANFKNPEKAHKEYCEMVTGFNQKLWYSSKYLQPLWKSIFKDVYNVTPSTGTNSQSLPTSFPDGNSQDKYVRMYGGLTSVNSRLKFRNNMNGVSSKIKIHLIAQKDVDPQAMQWDNALYRAVGDNNRETAIIAQKQQAIDINKVITGFSPYYRPYSPVTNTTDSHANYALVTPGTKLTESEEFNQRFTILKTFARTLDVGDEFALNLQYSFGPGVRLDRALALAYHPTWNDSFLSDMVAGFQIIVELQGPSVTAETSDTNLQDKFIGTAPVSVSWEAKHYLTYALANGEISTNERESNFESSLGKPLIKGFVVDTVVAATPFNQSYYNCVVAPIPTLKVRTVTTAQTFSNNTVT